jgi:hypothetical protein
MCRERFGKSMTYEQLACFKVRFLRRAAGFEITSTGEGFVSWRENLYGINLNSGALSLAGQIGSNQGNIIGLTTAATVPIAPTFACVLLGFGLIGWSKRCAMRVEC